MLYCFTACFIHTKFQGKWGWACHVPLEYKETACGFVHFLLVWSGSSWFIIILQEYWNSHEILECNVKRCTSSTGDFKIQHKLTSCVLNRDHSGCELSQWEMTLRCNVFSYWLSSYQEWSLLKMPGSSKASSLGPKRLNCCRTTLLIGRQ